jgi:hypothetical protein
LIIFSTEDIKFLRSIFIWPALLSFHSSLSLICFEISFPADKSLIDKTPCSNSSSPAIIAIEALRLSQYLSCLPRFCDPNEI